MKRVAMGPQSPEGKHSILVGTSFFQQLASRHTESETSGLRIDAVDTRLVAALEADGRASYAALGEVVGITRSAARQRVKRLIDGGIVAVHGRVDPSVIGIGVFTLVFVSATGPVRRIGEELAIIPEAVFVTETVGAYDILVELHCSDHGHLHRTLERVRSVAGVRHFETASILTYTKQRWDAVDESSVEPAAASPAEPDTVDPLDPVDQDLAAALQRDGRASFAFLAEIAGLSLSSTRERVLRLIRSGAVEIKVMPGVESIGSHQFVGILMEVDGPTGEVLTAAALIPETTVVAALSGAHNVGIEAWTSDISHLSRLLNSLRELPGVVGLETSLYLHANRFFDQTGAD